MFTNFLFNQNLHDLCLACYSTSQQVSRHVLNPTMSANKDAITPSSSFFSETTSVPLITSALMLTSNGSVNKL
ncbi:hypothetical protein BLNAU_1364 [Blattamonas nauphoetae]|uniref:Uncharacterized protein n=1 Tax=Blattamonas nauphoetae TaxID=2049346 RepID=A0ABQ9YJ74_9EUKA|nr:hypothetical protein BLNAU_1364 [Blattamonas nauphoetae]